MCRKATVLKAEKVVPRAVREQIRSQKLKKKIRFFFCQNLNVNKPNVFLAEDNLPPSLMNP